MLTQSGAMAFLTFLKTSLYDSITARYRSDDLQEISLTNGTYIIWGRTDVGQKRSLLVCATITGSFTTYLLNY